MSTSSTPPGTPSGVPMLEVRDLHAYYGKSHILQGVNIHVGAGEVVSLLGRNGVGRSTTIKAIMGEVTPQGIVNFKGRNIAGLPSYKIARLGLGYVPENREIFPTLTVRPVLEPGAACGYSGRRFVGGRKANAHDVPHVDGRSRSDHD
jgi:ABC-type branched-subunit amino acid transport system ATPase component